MIFALLIICWITNKLSNVFFSFFRKYHKNSITLEHVEHDDLVILENFDEESDTDVEDHLEIQMQNFETEHNQSDESESEPNQNKYYKNDKLTKWYFNPKFNKICFRAHNLIRHLLGVIKDAISIYKFHRR